MSESTQNPDDRPSTESENSPAERDGLRLVVETEQGLFVRLVRSASALEGGIEVGPAAEDAARSAAAAFGLPDFVFRSAIRSRGSGNRELGDAIVIVGEVAAVIQVKARNAATEDEARESKWLGKRIAQAARQALGTIRMMRGFSGTLVNERDRAIQVDGTAKKWVPVVVIDHPHPPNGYCPARGASDPSIVLLRRDWEFLFEQLKSTDAVIRYLHRVSPMMVIPLGDEPRRYYELAAADFAAEPTPLDPRLSRPGVQPRSTPLLPQAPAGSDERRHHVMIRMILEDIALSPRPPDFDEAAMLEVLAAIDTLPVGYRTDLGRDLISWLREAETIDAEEVRWRVRRVNFPDRPQILLAVASQGNEEVREAFPMLVTIRHQQHVEALGDDGRLLTAGILLTPRHDGKRPWDTTMASVFGLLTLDDE